MTELADGLFDSSPHGAVQKGICVIVKGEDLIYAGPITEAPCVAGTMVYLNQADFDFLAAYVKKRRN